jgi:putative hydrolase of the HAD superfamily
LTVNAILFDADGVIQWPAAGRREAWISLLRGDAASFDAFWRDISDIERSCYTGAGDFTSALVELVARWRCTGSAEDLLNVWTAIEPDKEIVQLVRDLRLAGQRCYLATNQEPYRCRFMSETLAYKNLFDAEFYSCVVGEAKPDHAYFQAVIGRLALPAKEVLFVDDHQINIDAAREVGLQAHLFTGGGSNEMRELLARFNVVV